MEEGAAAAGWVLTSGYSDTGKKLQERAVKMLEIKELGGVGAPRVTMKRTESYDGERVKLLKKGHLRERFGRTAIYVEESAFPQGYQQGLHQLFHRRKGQELRAHRELR